MADDPSLIPPLPVIRERLARNRKEARLLRGLLRLSIKAAEDRAEEQKARATRKGEP
jgi:hypothetical protein